MAHLAWKRHKDKGTYFSVTRRKGIGGKGTFRIKRLDNGMWQLTHRDVPLSEHFRLRDAKVEAEARFEKL